MLTRAIGSGQICPVLPLRRTGTLFAFLVAERIATPTSATFATSVVKLVVTTSTQYKEQIMAVLALATPMLVAAAGYSLIYLLMGGGLGGAILIFIVAKMLGK